MSPDMKLIILANVNVESFSWTFTFRIAATDLRGGLSFHSSFLPPHRLRERQQTPRLRVASRGKIDHCSHSKVGWLLAESMTARRRAPTAQRTQPIGRDNFQLMNIHRSWQKYKMFIRHERDDFMRRWTPPTVCCRQTTALRKRRTSGIRLELQTDRRLMDRPISTGRRIYFPSYSGSSSLSEQWATSSSWWCCCGAEVDRRFPPSCSLDLWRSPTSVWCSALSGSRLTPSYEEAGSLGSYLASYILCGNGWRWTVPYGLWQLSLLIGIYVHLNFSINRTCSVTGLLKFSVI